MSEKVEPLIDVIEIAKRFKPLAEQDANKWGGHTPIVMFKRASETTWLWPEELLLLCDCILNNSDNY